VSSVTSPQIAGSSVVIATQARTQAPARPAGSRVAPMSTLRRASKIVLVVGSAIAIAAAFGPTWLVRVGIVVAVTAAVLACVLAWRELFAARRAHAAAMLSSSRAHGAALKEERQRNGEVVDTLSGRVRDAGVVIERQRVTIAELQVQISGLKGDKAYLRAELDHREGVISSLRDTVRAREAELKARDAADAERLAEVAADVRLLPRRVLAEHTTTYNELPGAEDLWTDGSHPTVVDLKMLDTAKVLPNYEADRRVG